MKICIVGFDSLEYYLVEKYDLKYLKQKEYGKVEINTGILSTPTIWTSFITGLPPEEHGIIGWKWKNTILDRLKRWIIKIRLSRFFEKNTFLIQFVRKNIKGSVPNIRGSIPTIFDYANNPIDIDVPCYSYDAYKEIRHDVGNVIGNPISEKRIAEKAWKLYRDKKKRILNNLKNNWDLFMVHIYLPDVIQHLLWYQQNEIENLYKEMDCLAKSIKDSIMKNTLVIFISDHGQKKGMHTPNAFYSSNEILNLNEPKITEFADIVRQKLGAPSKDDIENIKERLKRLGYFG